MVETRLADVFVPAPFTANQIERTAELFAFFTSGIIFNDAEIAAFIGSGRTLDLPFYQDLSGDDNVWDDTNDIDLNKIDMAQDTAVVLTREKAWGSTSLAAALGQDDPMGAIQQLVDSYWARRYQSILINTLAGALANVTANVHDICALSGAASNIDGESFVDATQKLGDRGDDLNVVTMHSATEASLRKQDLIDFIPDSEGKIVVRTFQGRRVIIDDGMPLAAGCYTTYLFAAGSVSWAEETDPVWSNEAFRHPEKSGGTDALYTRRKVVLHPRGIRWTPASGVPASATPSNAELADTGNWTRVWEAKNIRIVSFVHTLL